MKNTFLDVKFSWGLGLAYGALALSMGLVGSYVALSKPLVAVMPVFLLAWLRFAIGALAMGHWLQKPADEAPLTPATRRALFLQSFFGNFLFSLCMLTGISLTTATAAGVIMASMPAVVAALSWWILGDRIDRRTTWAIVLAVAGISLFSLDKTQQHTADGALWMGIPLPLIGNLLIMLAVACEAAYVVIGKYLTGTLSPRRITALINLWGLVLMTPLGIWAWWSFDLSALRPDLWALLVFYALAASVWSVWLWMFGLKSVPASRAGVFTVMLPVTAATIGVVFLGERLSALQWLAFGTALAGLVIATWPRLRHTTSQSDP